MAELEVIDGGVLAAEGFRGAAMHCGVKAADVPDLSLIVADSPCAAAATLTRNRFRAAPTYVTERHVANGQAQAIVANSGNANCATGAQGMANAERMAEVTASELGLQVEDVLVCSTGIIGHQLPIANIEAGIRTLAGRLGRDDPELVARGIMTTDTFPKTRAFRLELGGREVRIGGIAKGAGMIAPNMATMLSFVTTDAAVEPAFLRDALRWAVDRSFNCISVDGCMSTNDTVIALANGAAGAEPIGFDAGADAEAFRDALLAVLVELAKMIAGDGEGATKLIEVSVSGAPSFLEARRIARAVATYDLLKAAVYGEQFNWGRVVAALGSAGGAVDPARARVRLAGLDVWCCGEPVAFDEAQAREALKPREVRVEVDLRVGEAEAKAWTCDLTEDFVRENAGYEGPPAPEEGS
ncbi:MAG: bifunctional glutamate N-acetyltransferase/amino-acid acetyltransferase ArgJ [Armatimonadetes bacterium]|nr:bifunctional glutamate N-acetyltransferase/amino-acid acetyltransferase ArgJ [Armatimonadota bacterium]